MKRACLAAASILRKVLSFFLFSFSISSISQSIRIL
jgi:hypothetical protein